MSARSEAVGVRGAYVWSGNKWRSTWWSFANTVLKRVSSASAAHCGTVGSCSAIQVESYSSTQECFNPLLVSHGSETPPGGRCMHAAAWQAPPSCRRPVVHHFPIRDTEEVWGHAWSVRTWQWHHGRAGWRINDSWQLHQVFWLT